MAPVGRASLRPHYVVFSAAVLSLILTASRSYASIDHGDSEGSSSGSEVICPTQDDCYPLMFEPTTEFRDVREGQVVPQGLHVRINISTGVKQARLLDNLHPKENSNLVVVVDKGRSVDAGVAPTSVEDGTTGSVGGMPPGLATDIAGARNFAAKDHFKYRSLVQQVVDRKANDSVGGEELAATLEDLADMVHDREFGLELAEGRGFAALIELLDHTNWKVRKASALAVGNAAQNNPPVQVAAIKMNLIDKLLTALKTELVSAVAREQLYALSAIMRGNHTARMFFLDVVRGLAIMGDIWRKNAENDAMRQKIVVFVTDLLDESMDPAVSGIPTGESSAVKFHRKPAPALNLQLDQNDLQIAHSGLSDLELRDRDIADWCALLSQDLVTSGERLDADMREKLVLGVEMLYQSSPTGCSADPLLRQWLLSENVRFVDNRDFKEYAALVLRVAELLALKGSISP